MKKITSKKSVLPVLSGAIIIAMSAFTQPGNTSTEKVKSTLTDDTLLVKKINQQYSKDIIAIDPNPSRGQLHVKNTSTEIKEVQFYVFDLEGVMIENLKLVGNERKKISGLNKGTYMYEVFNEDESIERGKIIVE